MASIALVLLVLLAEDDVARTCLGPERWSEPTRESGNQRPRRAGRAMGGAAIPLAQG
jgi:hypothetical protein